MKRDLDLIRLILLELEKRNPILPDPNIELENYNFDTIQFHVKLLIEQNLIEGSFRKHANGKIQCFPIALTWQGYDFLDAARDNIVWNKAKNTVVEKTQSVSFEVFKALLIQIAKDMIFPK